MLSFVLMSSALFSLSACGTVVQSADLMEGFTAKTIVNETDLTDDSSEVLAKFAVSLFQKSITSGRNTLISPLSVLCALSMTANGAKNETLTQMEDVFVFSVPELNDYLHTYLNNLPSGDKYKVSVANSIWFKNDDSLTVEKDFLQTNADYYNASVYKAAFDNSTLNDINTWVSDKTDGMIKNILDEISENAVMYLINALSFDAEWETIYTEDQVQDGTFTAESGETRNVKMMYNTEDKYLDDGSATGFIKYYADRKYAFVAMLPNEGVSIDDYVASLTGEGLMNTLDNALDTEVKTSIPKFESEYDVEMSGILKSMGMTDAFDVDKADFTGLAKSENGNIFIGRVIHKTYISVDEKGTEAGAATVVEMNEGCAMPTEEIKTVYLDRPFVYMLIDCETNLPIFIGTVIDIE